MSLTHRARVRDLKWLEKLLQQLEDPKQRDRVPSRADEYEFISPQDHLLPGEVRLTSGSGGARSMPSPTNVVKAACDVLSQCAYADVVRKLAAHGGAERHAVLIVDEEKDPSFDWLRGATSDDVSQLPPPVLADGITHLWITRRYVPGMTVSWSQVTGWQGFDWPGGNPIDELDEWDDPACPEDHRPGAASMY